MANEVGKLFNNNKKIEVFKLTGCRPGGVPPFGSLFGI